MLELNLMTETCWGPQAEIQDAIFVHCVSYISVMNTDFNWGRYSALNVVPGSFFYILDEP